MGNYDDIINLPRHVSSTRPRMSMIDRAAQFQPFRALTGYEDTVRETARLTQERVELTDEERARLDVILQTLADSIDSRPQVVLTYFQPDKKKAGGAYVTATGQLRACLKSSNEDGNEGKRENLSGNVKFAFTIFPKSAEFVEPAEKTLYHPAAWQNDKLV